MNNPFFKRTTPRPPEPEEATPVVVEIEMPPVKPVLIQMPDIIIDASESLFIPLEVLQQFWRFVYECQPGLIARFKTQHGVR